MMAGARVLMVHPGAELYGADRVFIESVAAAANLGARVTVVLPQPGPLVAELERLPVNIRFCSTPVLRKSLLCPRGLLGLASLSFRALVAGSRLIADTRPDLVYISTLTIPLWGLMAKLSGRPVLTHVHEAEESAPILLQRVLAAPLVLSSSIVFNSHYSARVLARTMPLLSNRAEVVYNGLPLPGRVAPARQSVQGALRLIYVGRLSRRKGVDVAVEALALARRQGVNASLDIVGDVFPGYEEFEEALRERVSRLGLDDIVTFHGFIGDVWQLRNESDVAIVPSSLEEPFGNTAVEAILSARPLIASDMAGLREAAAGYESAQLVPPGDVEAFARAIANVSARWSFFRGAAAEDSQRAARRHSLQKYGSDITRHMGALVSRRRKHVLA